MLTKFKIYILILVCSGMVNTDLQGRQENTPHYKKWRNIIFLTYLLLKDFDKIKINLFTCVRYRMSTNDFQVKQKKISHFKDGAT